MNKPTTNAVNTLKIQVRNDSRLELNAEFYDGCSYMELIPENTSDEYLVRHLHKNSSLVHYANGPWQIIFTDEIPRIFSAKDLASTAALLLSYILTRNSDYDDYYC